MFQTVESEHGSKTHFVVSNPDKDSVCGIVTHCGHNHWDPEDTHSVKEAQDVENPCNNCLARMDNVRECRNCGRAIAPGHPQVGMCDQCQDEAEARAFANIEAPEGGWERGSDMDRI